MNVKTWLADARKRVDLLDAEIILTRVLCREDRSYLAAHENYTLDEMQLHLAEMALRLREKGQPLAYILAEKEFYGRKFGVNPDVLIPRPETEDIIDLVKKIKPKKVLDVGTGSGCIGVTLKCEMPEIDVACSDVSIKALAAAEDNAKRHEADGIKFIISDLLDDIHFKPDLIVANLPYVDPKWEWIDTESLKYEPSTALYAADHGLALIKKLINQCKKRKVPRLILEADPSQHKDIIEFASKKGFELAEARGFILFFVSL